MNRLTPRHTLGRVFTLMVMLGVGVTAGSYADVEITGEVWPNPPLTGNPLYIGDFGTGEMTISNGSSVASSTGHIGNGSTGQGTVTVTGAYSTWTNTNALYVGIYYGTGELTISNGGSVSNNVAYIGENDGANGVATVTGNGSMWTSSNFVVIGSSGTGELTISNGGSVSNTSGWIAEHIGSQGATTVTGTSSQWTNSDELRVGNLGEGELTIEAGGNVSSTTGWIGAWGGSQGTATVTGEDSTWTNSGELRVGRSGTGELTIENGGSVSNSSGFIGSHGTGIGTVTVTGTDSTWANTGSLTVGASGTGELTIENGGSVSNTGTGYIGAGNDSQGIATVTGAGSTWSNEILMLGANIGGVSTGNGTLTISNGGTVNVVWTTGIHNDNSTINLQAGGTLNTRSLYDTGGNFNWTGGTLNLSGTYTGSLTIPELGTLAGDGGTITANLVNEGLLSPGNSPGTTTIEGDYTQESTGTLLIEIAGLDAGTEYDQLIVEGDANLAGTLIFSFIDDFTPENGDSFDFLMVSGTTLGDWSDVQVQNLSLPYTTSFDNGTFTFTVIPEPTSMLLLAAGSILVISRRRGRNV